MSWTTATLLFFANYSFRSSSSVPAHHSIILFTHFLLAFISAFTSYFIPRYFPSSFSTSTLSLLLHSNPFFHLAPFILSPSCPKEIFRYSLLQIHISILFQGIKKVYPFCELQLLFPYFIQYFPIPSFFFLHITIQVPFSNAFYFPFLPSSPPIMPPVGELILSWPTFCYHLTSRLFFHSSFLSNIIIVWYGHVL